MGWRIGWDGMVILLFSRSDSVGEFVGYDIWLGGVGLGWV